MKSVFSKIVSSLINLVGRLSASGVIVGFRSKSAGENVLRAVEPAQMKARQTRPGLMRVANTTRDRILGQNHPGIASFARRDHYLCI